MGKIEKAEFKISDELIERSMRQARVERSRVVWALLQRLFSRPDGADAAITGKVGFRLG